MLDDGSGPVETCGDDMAESGARDESDVNESAVDDGLGVALRFFCVSLRNFWTARMTALERGMC
jgi:hypothetical protein